MRTDRGICFVFSVRRLLAGLTFISLISYLPTAFSFVTFESGQVRPLALSPDNNRLFSVNTPDGRLEIFDIKDDGLTHIASVPVGMEPVAVAARSNNEVWVVNHLSDSISIVDVSTTPPRVIRTLLVGDEPRDIVFAGPGGNRAFITTAHRGQNSPYTDPMNPGELITPGIGRADVWVFDANSLGNSLGGSPLNIVTLFTDTPRALAVSPDGSTVYAAGFHTGNQTTVLGAGTVCLGLDLAGPCQPGGGTGIAPGGLPAPNQNVEGIIQPEVGLIVKYNGTNWVDELNRVWDDMVMFNLPDRDVFTINANANPPAQTGSFSGVGTALFNMVVNPQNGKVYVSNTEALNEVRFEGSRPAGSTTSTVQGKIHQTRITVLDGSSVNARHLNKHINYNVRPAPAGVSSRSLAIPMGMAVTGDGNTLYLAAFGSSKIGVFNTAQLENNSFVPDAASHIAVSGGGPSGLVLDEVRNRLYVLTRMDNAVTVIDTNTNAETQKYALPNPEPASVISGRPFLYDASLASSNGEASCASCHIFGDLDSLAWDLGDPEGTVLTNPNPDGPFPAFSMPFHPIKGPMMTQSLRGLADHGPMHWRGDRTAGRNGGDPFDEFGAFMEFNVAFEGLLGRSAPLTTAEMQAFTSFALQIAYPPNPIRPLNNVLTASQQAGRNFYFNNNSDGIATCNGCHTLDPANGLFGSSGLMSGETLSQAFKIPHLRNMYQKVGMFGMPRNNGLVPGDSVFMGDQIRGFGFIHNGHTDTLLRFFSLPAFTFFDDAERRDMEQFMLAFDNTIAPVVGQQATLNGTSGADTDQRINIMIARAAAGDSDLVVKGVIAGEMRGWVRQENGNFRSDKQTDAPLTDAQLRALSTTAGQQLTYTSTPPGEGFRIGIDQDQDSVLDEDDNCPAVGNSLQQNSDGDALGDACDNCTSVSNSDQRDTNGDGYGNMCDADLDNSGSTNTLDLQLYRAAHRSRSGDINFDPDADFNGDGRINTLDMGIFRGLYRRAPGPSCCS